MNTTMGRDEDSSDALDGTDPTLDQSCEKSATRSEKASEPCHPQLEDEHTSQADTSIPLREGSSRQIGPYHLLEPIGRGGMGEVWVAQQLIPVKRQVALKLIKPGIGSKEIIARFDAERQALALMNHPNIARILDAGTTNDGQPFFVMELVQGQPLTAYCDQNRLSIEKRLTLFMDVCSGVQHAHQKGIIHRDLKPGNILVSIEDAVPVPKIIDFGLAKAMESTQRLTDQSLFTGLGRVLGTLKYMSPEQASLDNQDIDTRADIYSLGVILYKLLTGSTPLDDSSIKDQTALRVLEYIRDMEPVKPSSKLSSSTGEQLSSITSQRQTDSVRLKSILQGDLDWIVMKSLEKDRARRYDTASDFAADIRRYLDSEPILARPPSLNYRVGKFVRKNRAVVVGSGLVMLSLLGGMTGTTWAMFRAIAAERQAEDRLVEANRARSEEETQRRLAEQRRLEAERDRSLAIAAKTQADLAVVQERAAKETASKEKEFALAINQFVRDDFLALTSVEGQMRFGGQGLDRNTTLYQLLTRAAEKLRLRKDLDPLIEADLSWIIGVNFRAVGQAAKGVPFLERSYQLRRQHLGEHDELTLQSMSSLAICYSSVGHLDQAFSIEKNIVEIHKEKGNEASIDALIAKGNLGYCYIQLGAIEEGISLLESTLSDIEAKLGFQHPNALTCLFGLVQGYFDAGLFSKAMPLAQEALSICQSKYGPEHQDTLFSSNLVGALYLATGFPERAIKILEPTFESMQVRLGPDHPYSLSCKHNIAQYHGDHGNTDKALIMFEELAQQTSDQLGDKHSQSLLALNNLAAIYWELGDLEKSIPIFEKLLEIREEKLGRNHVQTLIIVGNLGVNYKDAGRVEQALPLLEEAFKASRRFPEFAGIRRPLRDAYSMVGRSADFLNLAEADLSRERRNLPPDSLQLAIELFNIGEGYYRLKLYQQAEELLRECVTIRLEQAADDWVASNSQSVLGGILMGKAQAIEDPDEKSKVLNEAEQLLLSGFQGLQQRISKIPPQGANRPAEALDRLIELYTLIDNSDEKEKYLKLREQFALPVKP